MQYACEIISYVILRRQKKGGRGVAVVEKWKIAFKACWKLKLDTGQWTTHNTLSIHVSKLPTQGQQSIKRLVEYH